MLTSCEQWFRLKVLEIFSWRVLTMVLSMKFNFCFSTKHTYRETPIFNTNMCNLTWMRWMTPNAWQNFVVKRMI